MNIRDSTAIAMVLWVLSGPALAETVTGKVVGIADGDTLSLLDHRNKRHKIRLQGIDAPEKRQAWGRRSMQDLAALAFHKEVTADCGKVDKYGREICKVLVGDRDVNLAQIESGMAWWYRAYATEQEPTDRAEYAAAEGAARSARKGLWSDPNAQAPWDWRRKERSRFPKSLQTREPGDTGPEAHR